MRKILIVEDEEAIANLIRINLTGRDIIVLALMMGQRGQII